MARGDIRRAFRIASVLCSRLVFHRLNSHRKKALGVRLREACEELGTSFIKIGQILSLRYDILEESDCEELRKLLDAVPPFGYATVREIVRHDLGGYPEELFARFSEEPIASASIAQVHLARLKGGRKVAVKVRRPYIGKAIERDMRIFRALVKAAQAVSPRLRRLNAAKVVDEMAISLVDEIDLRKEARNIEALKPFTGSGKPPLRAGLGRVITPDIHPTLCSYNVLTMDFIEGVPLARHKELAGDPAYDVLKSANTFMSMSVDNMFRDEAFFFHADPHPANVLVLKGGDVALLDFGIVGSFSAEFTRRCNSLFFSVYMQDPGAVARESLRICGREPDERTVVRIMPDIEEYLARAKGSGIGFWFMGLIKVFVKHRLEFPAEFTMLGRSNLIFDGVVHMVASDKSTLELIGPELRAGVRRRMLGNIAQADYAPLAYVLAERLRVAPASLARLIDRYADDPLRLLREVREGLAEEGG